MVRALAAALAAATLLLVSSGPAQANSSAQVSETHLEGGRLAVTVHVTGLPRGRSLDGRLTQVRVNGQEAPARVAADASSRGSATAVVVVDSSGSMGKDGIAAAREAAASFARRVSVDVPVGLIRFSDRPELLLAPTTDRSRLANSLRLLKPRNGTALYDAVAMASRTVGRDGAVVVLSDGADTASRSSLDDVSSQLSRSGVSVNTVAFRTPGGSRQPLEQLARAGRGRAVAADGAKSLADAFTGAAAALPAVQHLVVDLPDDTRQGSLEVSVSDGRSTWVASGSFPGETGAGAALQTTVVGPGQWYTSLWLVLLVVFVGVAVLGWLALPRPASPTARREAALAVYTVDTHVSAAHEDDDDTESGIVSFFDRVLKGRDVGARMAMALDRAGSRLRPAEWVVIRVCVSLGFAAVVTALAHNVILGLLFGVLLGWGGSLLWLRRRQGKRLHAFADALPDTLHLVASSLRTGFSLPQALDAAHQDGVEPIAGELGRALAAARIGAPLEDELEEIGKRMQNEDWRWAVMAIRIQRSVGGNLAEVLLTTVRTLRERAATRRQIRALSAEGMLSAYILIGLPILVALVLLLFRRAYLAPLWSVPGLVMVVVSTGLLVAGWFWMRKVVKVEV